MFVLEGTYGVTQNRLGAPSIASGATGTTWSVRQSSPARCQCTLGGLASLFPDAGVIDPRLLRVQCAGGSPRAVLRRRAYPPSAAAGLGGPRNSQPALDVRLRDGLGCAPPSLNYPGWYEHQPHPAVRGGASPRRAGRTPSRRALTSSTATRRRTRAGNLLPGYAQPRRRYEQSAREHVSPFRTPRSASSRTTPRARSSSKATSTTTASSGTSRTTGRSSPRMTMDYGIRFVTMGAVHDAAQQVRELLPRQVERRPRAGALRSRLRRRRESVRREQPAGQGPAQRGAPRRGQPAHRPGHHRHGRFRQRHGASRATTSTRPATPSRGSSAGRGSALPTTSRAQTDRAARGPRALLRSARRQHGVRHRRQPAHRDEPDTAVGPALRPREQPVRVRAGANDAGLPVRRGHSEGLPVEPGFQTVLPWASSIDVS